MNLIDENKCYEINIKNIQTSYKIDGHEFTLGEIYDVALKTINHSMIEQIMTISNNSIFFIFKEKKDEKTICNEWFKHSLRIIQILETKINKKVIKNE